MRHPAGRRLFDAGIDGIMGDKSVEDVNTSGFQFNATYQNIADWVWEEYGMKVSRLYRGRVSGEILKIAGKLPTFT